MITLTTLPSVDMTQNPPIIELKDANLDHADLSGLQLGAIDLREVHLRHANLTDVGLGLKKAMVTIQAPTLEGADLSHAKLRGTNLVEACMRGVILRHADLTNTTFAAVDLTGADLTGATGWTTEQLKQAKSLKGATMPNGQKYEEWLKDRDNGS